MTVSKVIAVLAASAFCIQCLAQDRPITRTQLPPAVAATADREVHGATIKGYSTERENGAQTYEVETIADGRTRDISIGHDGQLLEVEQQVSLDQLPQDAQAGLKRKAMGASIVKIESLTKHGQLVAYESVVRNHGHSREIQIGSHGQTLRHEE